MPAQSLPQDASALFDPFKEGDLDIQTAERIVDTALTGMDDGELFVETSRSEAFSFDDGRLKSASFDSAQGFGLRAVTGESTGYAHATDLSEPALKRAADTVQAVRTGEDGAMSLAPARTNEKFYSDADPLGGIPFADKVALLEEVDAYARAADPRVRQVSASLLGSWRAVDILRAGGERMRDIRPLTRLNVSVVMGEGDRQETGYEGDGARRDCGFLFDPAQWRSQVDEAVRLATVNLESVAAPAGEMTVVIGPGWPGVLLHEAVGHGLEGDFNRKKTSAFAGLMGERVAAPGVTVIDDGTMPEERGSLTIDDEGTPTGETVLIEDGILKGYMQDRLNARLMGQSATGNGRRQSFAHAPMPRMTNTYMLAGSHDPAEILASVEDGLFAVSFGGGQVDITSGKFVFTCTEAYRIRGGRVAEPVKGATLIGNGPDVLTRVSMIGNDLKMGSGVGTCGKNGQQVPVGIGQPTLRIDGLTVGGTAA